MKDFFRLQARPTVVVSTISPRGISNAAPFSFSSPMASKPVPLFGFCCEVEHDTWRNIRQNGEFVINLVGEGFGPLMEKLETNYPYEVSEIRESGLTEIKSIRVKPPRIAEAYGWLECRMRESVELSDRAVWIIGEVVESDAKDNLYDTDKGAINVEKVKPLHHIWGDVFTTSMREIKFKRASKS
jgi:flavin reductase (DIM6/NTAB) family NADH-FMN oxidoreductase RutF